MLPTMGCPTRSTSSPRCASATRLFSLFDAVPAALNPSRFPIALMFVFIVMGIFTIGDGFTQRDFTTRGLHAPERTPSDARIAAMRAQAAVREAVADPVAFDGMLQLLAADQQQAGDGVLTWNLSIEALREIARDGVATRLDEIAADATLDDAARARATTGANKALARALATIEEVRPRRLFESFAQDEKRAASQVIMELFALDFDGFLVAISQAVAGTPAALWRADPVAASLVLLAVLACACFAMTALSRMSASELARGIKLSAREGAWFARDRSMRCLMLPLAPVALVAVLLVIPAVLSALLWVPGVDMLSAVLFPAALLFSLLACVVAVVASLALLLMPPAVAVEDADLADAVTRAASLVIARPMDWFLVLLITIAAISIGSVLVGVGLEWSESLLLGSGSLFSKPTTLPASMGLDGGVDTLFSTQRYAGLIVSAWFTLFHALFGAYVLSLLSELATRAYFLMRFRVEGEDVSSMALSE